MIDALEQKDDFIKMYKSLFKMAAPQWKKIMVKYCQIFMVIFESKERGKQSKREKFIDEIMDYHNTQMSKKGHGKMSSSEAELIFKCMRSVYRDNMTFTEFF